MIDFESINERVRESTVDDYRIDSYHDGKLTLVGSVDFSYYHEIEIVFFDVEYISLPSDFDVPRFSIASRNATQNIEKNRTTF